MSEQYQRLFLRWEVLRGYVPTLILAAICVGLEILFFYNALNTGFVDKAVSIPLGSLNVPFSISLALSLGNALLIVTIWMSVFESSAYVKTGPDKRVRRLIYPIRMIRTAATVLAPFSIILFVPYVVLTSGFANAVASIAALRSTTESFYTWAFSVSQIDGDTRFVISQLTAAFGALVVAGLQLWRVKGTKDLMRALRRRR